MIATVEFTLHQLHYARARALLTGADAIAKLSASLHLALRRAQHLEHGGHCRELPMESLRPGL